MLEQGELTKTLTRIGAETGKHRVGDAHAFPSVSSTRSLQRGGELRAEELHDDVGPAVRIDARRDDEGMRPQLVVESVLDGLATLSAKEEARNLVEVGGRNGVGGEGSVGACSERGDRSGEGELCSGGKVGVRDVARSGVRDENGADRLVNLGAVGEQESWSALMHEDEERRADSRSTELALVLDENLDQLDQSQPRLQLALARHRFLSTERRRSNALGV